MESRFAATEHTALLGRSNECAVIDQLVRDICNGDARSLLLLGEAGIGKTALLNYLVDSATDVTVLQAVGVQSDIQLAYASLHQLCGPLLDRLDALPAPQREAMEIVFGRSAGAAPNRFLVGVGALNMLSQASDERTVLCVVDDAQWLDQASASTLAFVARRLLAERVGVVFAARETSEELQNLSTLAVEGVSKADARSLLDGSVQFKLDEQVRDRIVLETRGNPLALLELPQKLTAAELAGGFGLVEDQSLSGRIEETFARRLNTLSDDAKRLLLVAAAEPVGDPLLLWRAAARLGMSGASANSIAQRGCSPSATALPSGTRWYGRPCTPRLHRTSAARCTWRLRRKQTGRWTRTAAPGTSPRQQPNQMRKSRSSWSVQPKGHRRAVASRPRRRS